MRPDSRSNGKPRFSENIWIGVTILQWSKRFDAALGSVPVWRYAITHGNCTQDRQLPKVEADDQSARRFIGLA
jgi:hypothetical protein